MVAALLWPTQARLSAQPVPSKVHPLHRPFDELLDIYVRDGFVYYSALRMERAKLDRYVAALNGPAAAALAKGSADERKALWINAYNALVLRTVIDHFPIRGRAPEYPAVSIRQVPGAFEKPMHRVAGRVVSLDGIEKDILAPLGDARVFLALGRAAYGGGRLRSEAFDGPTAEAQLAAVAAEAVTRRSDLQAAQCPRACRAGHHRTAPVWRRSRVPREERVQGAVSHLRLATERPQLTGAVAVAAQPASLTSEPASWI
jgi:hypothetical protein